MKNTLLKIWAIASISLFVASCDKDDDDDKPQEPARVMVIHASPDAPAVDVRVNGDVAATNLSFPNNTSYVDVKAGNASIQVAPTGTTNYVINTNANLSANSSYSILAVNKLNNITASVVTDNLTPPAAGKAHVRFFHLSPDAPAVDIAVKGGSVVFANRSFNDQATNASLTNFTALDSGTYNLEVRLAGQQAISQPLPPITIQAGKIYTVFAHGLLTGTGNQALGAKVIIHN